MAEVREALEESHVPHQVDLVDLHWAGAALRDAVRREGIWWTEPRALFTPLTEP